MDWALFHAIVLLTLPVILVVALWYTWVKLPGDWASIKRILGVLLLVMVIAFAVLRADWQWIVPGVCAIVFAALASNVRARRIGTIAFLAACVVLSLDSANPGVGYSRLSGRRLFYTSGEKRAGALLEDFAKEHGDVILSVGWLDEPGILVPPPSKEDLYYLVRPDLDTRWYTPMVGFAKLSSTRERAVWCPGGRISEVKDRLELRVREMK
jgi:hypothetical protein